MNCIKRNKKIKFKHKKTSICTQTDYSHQVPPHPPLFRTNEREVRGK